MTTLLENQELFEKDPVEWVKWRKSKYVLATMEERNDCAREIMEMAAKFENDRAEREIEEHDRIREIFRDWETDMYAARQILLASGMPEDEVDRIVLERE